MEDNIRAYSFGKGIPVASGFDLAAKSPLDHRTVVETLSQRDAMPDIQKYSGLMVFVEQNNMTYQYINNAWKEFGFNLGDFKLQLVDNLTTADANKALTANQGKVVKDLLDSHTADAVKHITASERTAWNNKLNLTGGTITGETIFNQYLSINAWSGYGTGRAQIWFDGNVKAIKTQPSATDLYLNNQRVYHTGHKPTKADVGLGSVDNTSDANKPVSTATQAALNLKFDKTGGDISGDISVAGKLTATVMKLNIGEGLEFVSDDNYFGTNHDARIIRAIDNNGTTVDGGIVFEGYGILDGTITKTEWLRLRHNEFKWKGNKIYHAGDKPTLTELGAAATSHTHNYLPLTGGTLTGKTIVTGPSATSFSTGQLQVRATENQGVPMITLHSNGRSYASISITEADTIGFKTERNGVLKHTNPNGYIHMGAMNATYCHIYTDRPTFYLNKELLVLGHKVYHANNKPTLTELGAAPTVHNHHSDYYTKTEINDRNRLKIKDTRADNPTPLALASYAMEMDFKNRGAINSAPGTTTYNALMSIKPWGNDSGSNAYQLSFGGEGTILPRLGIRSASHNDTTWGQWYEIYHTGKKPTKADVGLSNVDNTSDANKPISTATQTALNNKANTSHDHTTVGAPSIKIYPELNNEINFGGNHDGGNTIYFGYRMKDSKPIPATFVFGGTGTATLKAGNVQIGGNDVYHTGRKPSLTDLGAASTAVVTTSANGLMSKEDKAKLDKVGDIITLTKTLVLNTEWQDVGIEGTALDTGSHVVQISGMSTNTGIWYEVFTGMMSWYSGGTNNGSADEILLHKAGHASDKHIYLRTLRTVGNTKLKLQICCSHELMSSSYTFKFRKLI